MSGIDPRRTDVVTATATAALRPDLKVNSVNGSASAAPNTPVQFRVELAELNGDVGARSDCVLSVNGIEVGRISGIWVDAGDRVTCIFNHAFDQPGTYTVAATAANVNPGDWDTSNNSASTSVTIEAEGAAIAHGEMMVAVFSPKSGPPPRLTPTAGWLLRRAGFT